MCITNKPTTPRPPPRHQNTSPFHPRMLLSLPPSLTVHDPPLLPVHSFHWNHYPVKWVHRTSPFTLKHPSLYITSICLRVTLSLVYCLWQALELFEIVCPCVLKSVTQKVHNQWSYLAVSLVHLVMPSIIGRVIILFDIQRSCECTLERLLVRRLYCFGYNNNCKHNCSRKHRLWYLLLMTSIMLLMGRYYSTIK